MGKVIGIDLGTTNSCVAVVEGGRPVIIPNDKGERTTPSVVAFTKEGERLVGAPARRQVAMNAARTISSVKRQMGTDWRVRIDGKNYTAQEISAMILRKLRQDAEAYLGQPVTDAVITVPAYFNDIQRQATKDAGRIAGLNVERIINEPTSAALAYGLDNGQAQKIMVYDLGGGTFDVSIIEIGDGVIEVLATAGNNRLGGDDFDQRLTDHIVAQFKRENHIDLSKDPAAMTRVREAAEQAKKELSASDSTVINLPYIAQGKDGPVHLEMPLTRAAFVGLIQDLIDSTAIPVQNAVQDAGLTMRDLSRVLLVGGSTRIPAVQQKVRSLTGIEPSRSINPDECVAQGAAVQGDILSGGAMTLASSNSNSLDGAGGGGGILLLDVTPLSLSIETVGGVATRLVERNTTLPTRYSQVFTTAASFQPSVDIHVLQGERPMARDNKTIGRFTLRGIKKAMAGVPQIEVTFDIDTNGILKVSARDLDTGKAQSITITANDKMSEDEIQQAIRDAEQYASQDGMRRKALDVNNEAQRLLMQAERALGAAGKQIDKEEKKQVKGDIAALRKSMGKRADKMTDADVAAVQASMDTLRSSAAHIMEMTGEQP